MRKTVSLFLAALLSVSCAWFGGRKEAEVQPEEPEAVVPPNPLGFEPDSLVCRSGKVGNGETFTGLFTKLGLSQAGAHALVQACDSVFDVRRMQAGKNWDAYYKDSLATEPSYVVYHNSFVRRTVFACQDSLRVYTLEKPVEVVEKAADVTIHSSLWNDLIEAGASPHLIIELSDVYAWTVDFFGLHTGDRFRVLYKEKMCEGQSVGIDRIEYAEFLRDEAVLPAVYFDQQDGGNRYWNEKGESMRKAFLKAPLKFSRISSGFSYHRLHPVHGTVRAHTGVDYAAPTGTPVMSIGDGTVLSVGWGGGGGNTVKIRHNSVYTTAYLHLSKYAKGLHAGQRVRQGEVIGYVGMTGTATGPHLDFRVWKNGSPINPLKLESPPAVPVKDENLPVLDSLVRVRKVQLNQMIGQ